MSTPQSGRGKKHSSWWKQHALMNNGLLLEPFSVERNVAKFQYEAKHMECVVLFCFGFFLTLRADRCGKQQLSGWFPSLLAAGSTFCLGRIRLSYSFSIFFTLLCCILDKIEMGWFHLFFDFTLVFWVDLNWQSKAQLVLTASKKLDKTGNKGSASQLQQIIIKLPKKKA